MKRNSNLDFTPLLDVIMILLFIVLAGIGQRAQVTKNELAAAETEIEGLLRDKDALESDLSRMQEQNGAMAQELDTLNEQYSAMGLELDSLTEQNEEMASELDTLTQQYGEMGLELDAITEQYSDLLAITEYANKIGETNEALIEWEKEPEPRPEYGTWYTIKQTIKFIIIGGIAGVVIMLIWFAAKYAVSSMVKTDDDWRRYQLPILGRVLRTEEKQKFLPWLDTLIDRIFGRTRTVTQEQSCALAAQNLGATLRERGLDGVSLVGRLPEGQAETLAQKLDTAGAGVGFRYAGDALADPAAAQNLEGRGEVLLLAERYGTRLAEVEQTLTLLKAWGKTALGIVVVE